MPAYWTNQGGGQFNEHIESKFMLQKCQQIVDKTFKPRAGAVARGDDERAGADEVEAAARRMREERRRR